MSNTPTMSRGHNFELHGYGVTPTQCFICNEFLNGFWQEGYQCQNCSINVHDACRSQASGNCFVTHRFKETSYMYLATCAACGQPMLGLWKQGFKCEDCGLDVHPACRTQSSISSCRAAATPEDVLQLPASSLKTEDQQPLQSGQNQPRRRSVLERTASHRLASAGGSSNNLLQQEPLPTDFEGVKREIRKLHEEQLESSRKLDDQWEKVTKPALKAQRAQIQLQYDHLKTKQKEKQNEVVVLSNTRDEAFRTFLKTFYQKYNPTKVKNVESVVRHYGNGSCRERDMFSELIEKYANEPTAVALIDHERSFGPLAASALETALIELEELASQVSKTKSALAAVRRDVYFAPNIPWLVKGGAEGTYAGFTALWLENATGVAKINCNVCKGEISGPLPPGDDGYRPRISVQLSGHEETPSEPGWKFSARLEDMCISGSALPIALSLRDADIAVQFDLLVEAQYDPPTSPDDPCGAWRVLDGGFKLKVHKFYLKTKNTGGLSIPDVVLGALIQTFITLAFKKIIVLVMPPEVGTYMMAVHHHRTLKRKGTASTTETGNDASTQNHHKHHEYEHGYDDANIWQSSSDDPNEERFLKIVASIKIQQTLNLEAVDASLQVSSANAEPSAHQKKVMERLHIDKDQMRLMLLAQKELGLTFGSLWGNDNSDWLSTIATTVTGTGQDLNRIPLQSLLDFVKYQRDYLDPSNASSGMAKSRRVYVCQRLHDLWQLALDMVCENFGGELPESGITGKMKRMVTQRLTKTVNLKSFEFAVFAKRLGELAKKEIYSEVEVSVFEIALAVRGLVRTLRDTALRVIGKKAATAVPGRMASAAAMAKKTSSAGGNGVGKDFASAIQHDRAENKESLVPNFGKTLPVQIQRASDFILDRLRELQERYVDSIRLRVELVAGDGNYRAAAHEIRLVAPVDVGLQIGSKLMGGILSRTVKHGADFEQAKWLWNRKVLVEDNMFKVIFSHDNKGQVQKPMAGGMVEALRRMGGKAAQAAEKDSGEFHVTCTGVFAQMRTETGAVQDVLSVHVRPLMDPERVEVKALGAGAMRVHATIDKVESQGQFATLFHYTDDFIASISKNQPDLARLRVLPKFVAGFAARDSFYIDTLAWINVRSEASAGDVVVHSSNLAGRRCVRVGLTHNLQDLIHDLFDLMNAATKISPKEKA